jgi:anti-sigma B factor antagonist
MNTPGTQERLIVGHRLDHGIAAASAAGDAHIATRGLLRDGLPRAVTDKQHHALVVNLATVTVLDSVGISELVGAWRRARANHGALAVAIPSPQARHTPDITGLPTIIPIYDFGACGCTTHQGTVPCCPR